MNQRGREKDGPTAGTAIVPLRESTRTWFAISLRTFGGPSGQIAVMHRELVDERRWIGERRFLHALSFCTLLPGPEAQQLAIYLGWLLNGTAGGLIAGTLFVLPGYLALLALSAIYAQWGETAAVAALFAGLAPAVLAIVAQALWRIGRRALHGPVMVGLAVTSFASLFLFAVPFPFVVLGAAVVGYGASLRRPDLFAHTDDTETDPSLPPPLIADDALHGERPSWRRALRILAIGLPLWATPVVLAAALLGSDHVLVDQGAFFSGTAVITFGGAYAVLSFVAQRAVEAYRWLAPGEMIHGLALAETTPGPLIMVVEFVGFIGAYRNPGDLDPWVAGVLGATIVVWVTFVPCFLFVLLGAPHIESLRHNVRLSAALSAVTAAVVGVIANLSAYFAVHTLFDRTSTTTAGPLRVVLPMWSSAVWQAFVVVGLAFVLVFRLRWGVLRVIGCCAAVGAVLHLLTN